LVGGHPPGQRRICPRFDDVSQGQIDELGWPLRRYESAPICPLFSAILLVRSYSYFSVPLLFPALSFPIGTNSEAIAIC
jgi:hypothetical protein